MAIDQFTLAEFEQALDNIMPLGWQSLGIELNEYCYVVEVNSNARIHIRSSVGESGIADEAGQDSIRLNLEVWQPDFRRNGHYDWIALPKKAIDSQRWVTRVPGWQKRLEDKIKLYWNVAKKFRQPVEFCSCNKAPFVGISKSNKNEGRPYSSCLEKYGGCGLFKWLDKPLEGKVEFDDSISLQPADETISPGNGEKTQAEKSMQNADSQLESDVQNDNTEQDTGEECLSGVLEDSEDEVNGHNSIQVQEEGDVSFVCDETLQGNDLAGDLSLQERKGRTGENRVDNQSGRICEGGGDLYALQKKANSKQLEAIHAPIDANVRVLAPPGSGKTFIIEQRYKYLIDNGVNPDNILVVTFSKSMADEMGARILDACPIANVEQISTIHAFCYRLLTKWDKGGDYYGWRVAGGTGSPVKSWEIKKWLDDFISDTWGEREEKPGYQEVLSWIDTSKYHGYHYDDPECLEWFISVLGLLYGKRVYDIRFKFDKALYQRKCMTFADMLLLIELKLKEDFAFRIWCQDKFTHVIVDEGQDTAYNAMRVLITIAAESGKNPIEREEKCITS